MPRGQDIRIRRDTAANWAAVNPTLNAGEQGYETDTRQRKVGDGATAWNSLPYAPAKLSSVAQSLTADVGPLTASTTTTLLTTSSLSVGVWLVSVAVTAVFGSAAVLEVAAAAGTATVTFTGVTAGGNKPPAANSEFPIALSFLATVTVAGTITITGTASNGQCTVKAATFVNALPGATGLTAVKIA